MPAAIADWPAHVRARLRQEGGCLVWPGARHSYGYGQVRMKNRLHLLHRLMYEWHCGPIPEGMQVMHTCDNPPCCNPTHLQLGTARDNSRDMSAKGRWNNQSIGKTHCKRGHLLGGENLRKTYDGSRQCRTCVNLRKRERRAEARLAR